MTGQPEKAENAARLAQLVREKANEIGFDLVGIAPAVSPGGFGPLQQWLKKGFAGEMTYMPRREDAYRHPEHVLPEVRSLVMVAVNYLDRSEDGTDSAEPAGKIARYATGSRDYHDVLRKMLKQLAAALHDASPSCRTRGIVDTAPLLERDFARLAGLGWFGKNTMLLNKRVGSYFFLGALLTDVELETDAPHETAHCGTCTRCLEACPTDAFPEPYVLDATKCISYLTIELRDQPIDERLREGMGEWLFGCDICQEVCPWNRKAPETTIDEFRTEFSLTPGELSELLSLSDEQFRERFRKTPLFRSGRAGLLRNAAIVAGNTRDARLLPALSEALGDKEELVRGAAAWALGQFGGLAAEEALRTRLTEELSLPVRHEIEAALETATSSQ